MQTYIVKDKKITQGKLVSKTEQNKSGFKVVL